MGEKKKIVAFQGEHGAFSEMAARSYFGKDVEVVPQRDFSALFAAIAHEGMHTRHGTH